MRRAHRRRHFLIWVILAVALPILLAAAFSMRHSEPVNGSVPTVTR